MKGRYDPWSLLAVFSICVLGGIILSGSVIWHLEREAHATAFQQVNDQLLEAYTRVKATSEDAIELQTRVDGYERQQHALQDELAKAYRVIHECQDTGHKTPMFEEQFR